MSPPPTVFVVDDDASVQKALVRLLTSAGYQARGFTSAQAFLAAYAPAAPGCLILDLQMPYVTGLDLMETLRVTDAVLEVIFLSGRGDVPATAKAMKMGAVDFLTKPVDEQVLLEVVRLAAWRSAARWTACEEYAGLIERYERLTPREREVCALVARGRLNKQIASDLGTSEKTIKVHRARVMAKLDVASVAELVRFVDRLNAGAPREFEGADRVRTLPRPEA
jgi:FixJ family two-component response regulator